MIAAVAQLLAYFIGGAALASAAPVVMDIHASLTTLDSSALWPSTFYLDRLRMAFLGDLNRDGLYTEVAIGLPEFNSSRGAVQIVSINPTDDSLTLLSTLTPGLGLEAAAPMERIGASVMLLCPGLGGGGPVLAIGALTRMHIVELAMDGSVVAKLGEFANGVNGIPDGLFAAIQNPWVPICVPGSDQLLATWTAQSTRPWVEAVATVALNASGGASFRGQFALEQPDPVPTALGLIGEQAIAVFELGGTNFLALGAPDSLNVDPNAHQTTEGYSQGAVVILQVGGNGTMSFAALLGNTYGGLPADTLQDDDQFGMAIAPLTGTGPDGPHLAVSSAGFGVSKRRGAVYLLRLSANATTVLSMVRLTSDGLHGIPTGALGSSDRMAFSIVALGAVSGARTSTALLMNTHFSESKWWLLRVAPPVPAPSLSTVSELAALNAAGGELITLPTDGPPEAFDWLVPVEMSGVPLFCLSVSTCRSEPSYEPGPLNITRLYDSGRVPLARASYFTTNVAASSTWLDGASLPAGAVLSASNRAGAAVARLGDADADGCNRDFAVGMPGADAGGRVASGALLVVAQPCHSEAGARMLLQLDGNSFDAATLPTGAQLGASMAHIITEDTLVGRRTLLAAGLPGVNAVLLLSLVAQGGAWTVGVDQRATNGAAGIPPGTIPEGAAFGSATAARVTVSVGPSGLSTHGSGWLFVGAPGAAGTTGDVLVLPMGHSLKQGVNTTAPPVWLSTAAPGFAASAGDALGSALSVATFAAGGASWHLLAGAPGDTASTGAVHVVGFTDSGIAVAWSKLANGAGGLRASTLASGARFGSSVAWLGDADGDGQAQEVAVGLPGASTFMLMWLDSSPTGNGSDWAAYSWAAFSANRGGLSASAAAATGTSLAPAGDWDGDNVANQILVGALEDGGDTGSLALVRLATRGGGVPPAVTGSSLAVHSVSPSNHLPHDTPTVVTIRGSGLYQWDPLLGEASHAVALPRVLLSGRPPNTCLHVAASRDGRALTCTLPGSFDGSRQLRVEVGANSTVSQLTISHNIVAWIDSVEETEPVRFLGGERRTFTGSGLLSSTLFPHASLVEAGVALLIGDTLECPASDLIQSVDGKSIICNNMPSAVGSALSVRLRLPNGVVSNSTATVTYADPSVTGLVPAKSVLHQSASGAFTILGLGLGLRDQEVRAVIGQNECEDLVWLSSAELRCDSVRRNFSDHAVTVYIRDSTTGEEIESTGGSDLLQFDPLPTIIGSAAPALRTTGNETIECYGTSLGVNSHLISAVLIGNNPCQAWSLQSDAVLSCRTPPGTGKDKAVVINTTTGYSTPSFSTVSYRGPQLLSADPDRVFGDPAIRFNVRIRGSGFGLAEPEATPPQVSIAGRPCGAIVHVSDEELVCQNVTGPWGYPRQVEVVVNQQAAVSASLVSFQDPPRVIGVSPSLMATAADSLLTISGSGFGASDVDIAEVTVGEQRCLDPAFISVEQQQIRCRVQAGIGHDLNVSVAVRLNGRSPAQPLFSYEPPMVHWVRLVTGNGSLAFAYPGATGLTLAMSVSNCGHDTGSIAASFSSQRQPSLAPWTQACGELQRADGGVEGRDQVRLLYCRGVSLANFPDDGLAIMVKVAVGGQESDGVAGLEAVGPPSVSLLSPSAGFATTGSNSTWMQVHGRNLGRSARDLLGVDIGDRPCRHVKWKSDALVEVIVPAGVGSGQPVKVTTLGGRFDNAQTIDYMAAQATRLDPSYALTGEGLTSFTITGENFGNGPADLDRVLVGGRPCGEIRWVSPTQVRCLDVSRAAWQSQLVYLSVGGQPALLNTLFEPVGPPVISVLSPTVAAAGESLLLLGANFGHAPSDVLSVTVGEQPCSSLVHRGSAALSCVMPNPTGELRSNLPVVVQTAGGQRSEAVLVSYPGSGATPPKAPTYLLAWRPVGVDGEFTVRWAYPVDSATPEVEPVTSFTVELAELAENATARLISVRVSDLEDKYGGVATTSEDLRVFHFRDFAFTARPLSIRLRAANPSGDGPWSDPTPAMTVNCAERSFLQTHAALANWTCGPCPAGAYCGGAGAANVTATSGFWRVPWSRAGLGFIRCPRADSCLGYESLDSTPALGNGSAPAAGAAARMHANARRSLASPDRPSIVDVVANNSVPRAVDPALWGDPAAMERCAEGYSGTVCASCVAGYTRWGDFECRKCRTKGAVVLAMLGAAILMLVVVSYLIVSAIKSGAEEKPVGTAAIKVAFSHIQTVGIAASFNLEWPDSVRGMFAGMNTASSVSSEVLSLDCAMPSGDSSQASGADPSSRFFDKSAVVLALPILMVAVASCLWLIKERSARSGVEGGSAPSRPVAAPAATASTTSTAAFATGSPTAGDAVTNPLRQQRPGVGSAASLASSSSWATPSPTNSKRRRASAAVVSMLRRRMSLSPKELGVMLSVQDKIVTSAVVILFLVHMSVTTTSLQLLTCRDINADHMPAIEQLLDGSLAPAAEDGLQLATAGGCDAEHTHRRLVQDLDVCCYDPAAQRRMFGLGIPGLLVYALGIPVLGSVVLWWRRDSLQSHHTKATLGFLYAGFKEEAYYWESVVMLRKVGVAVIAVALEPMGVTLQTYMALLLIFGLAVTHTAKWPFSNSVLNRLELGALVAAYLTFECGLFLSDPATSKPVRGIATAVIFLANLAFLVVAAVVIVRDKLGGGKGAKQRTLQARQLNG